jgi:hypothetical protein
MAWAALQRAFTFSRNSFRCSVDRSISNAEKLSYLVRAICRGARKLSLRVLQ